MSRFPCSCLTKQVGTEVQMIWNSVFIVCLCPTKNNYSIVVKNSNDNSKGLLPSQLFVLANLVLWIKTNFIYTLIELSCSFLLFAFQLFVNSPIQYIMKMVESHSCMTYCVPLEKGKNKYQKIELDNSTRVSMRFGYRPVYTQYNVYAYFDLLQVISHFDTLYLHFDHCIVIFRDPCHERNRS